jgi:hypothetical protein
MGTLKDDNQNHIPDAFENISSNVIVAGSTKSTVDGKEFNSFADLPPDIRIRYEQAMPDFLEGMVNTIHTTNVETSFGAEAAPRSRPSTAARR